MNRKAMNITTEDYVRVDSRAAEIGCQRPTGMTLLPENFQSATSYAELRQLSEAATVRTLFRTNGLPLYDVLDPSKPVPYIQNNSFGWVGPTLFVSWALVSENPTVVTVALGVIANYLTDFLKGISGKTEVSLSIVVEKRTDRTCKRITYKGNVEGLSSLADIVKSTSDE
jgi:hypothetical protein